jgi:hypothetical protein
MKLLKQLAFAFAITFSMASFSPVIAAGKIENATTAQVKEAADSALANTKAALDAIKNGSDEDTILKYLNDVAQDSKKIEVGTILDPKRSKAVANIKIARKAVQDKDKVTAEDALNKSMALFQEIVDKL